MTSTILSTTRNIAGYYENDKHRNSRCATKSYIDHWRSWWMIIAYCRFHHWTLRMGNRSDGFWRKSITATGTAPTVEFPTAIERRYSKIYFNVRSNRMPIPICTNHWPMYVNVWHHPNQSVNYGGKSESNQKTRINMNYVGMKCNVLHFHWNR